jgi:ditrans,polycis-polyprenyl diphosphate synthase
MSNTLPQLALSIVLHRLHALATTLLLYLLSLGPIPKHVGFVMDGNRRYARGRGKRVVDGHTDGFQSLRRVCLFRCYDIPFAPEISLPL